jgi:uncharacterized membrane protein YphA (DoxX/SURF4 family)
MSQSKLALMGAALFMLWGAVHVIGGIMVFVTGFATYQNSVGPLPEVANRVLAYFSHLVAVIGAVVLAIGWYSNRRNSP